ncbi:MAG: photosystem II biogenesis protein Psp29 [Oscillatoriales cyanobacterium SM2_1_8]|nr:photosystem II biogenesis protein Psp29 [Oscillatoriales cyanobacterium SM2_1_8]
MNTVPTVADAKRAFLQAFAKPIESVYRRVVDELLVELHLLRVNQNFRYDEVFALGVVTVFDRFMAGYRQEGDRDPIFAALCQALTFDRERLQRDGAALRDWATQQPEAVRFLLTKGEGGEDRVPLARQALGNPQFKYSRAFAIGLYTLLEILQAPELAETEPRKQLLSQVGETWGQGDRLNRDLDLYLSNLEKVAQARQMMVDLVEAERKKREKKAAETTPTETKPETSATT